MMHAVALGDGHVGGGSGITLHSSMGMGITGSGRFGHILAGLSAEHDMVQQLDALSQLCDVLSLASEDTLSSSFAASSLVPPLAALLADDCSPPELSLLAARALTHLCDALPAAATSAVHKGVLLSLSARLLSIEYIDVAEQVGGWLPAPLLREALGEGEGGRG